MYIKSVNIQGFKSYREQENVENFSPKHNVIVGRNGSGKSNFFFAIQFVLSDEFTHLRLEQRAALLHEGTGPRVMTAKVEIVFDNTDARIPIEKDEVRLVRQIGAKKDQYFLDGKTVTRAEVQNLMESAGFSRSNPYYIVKQGKINELATSKDEVRLKLLFEVAGTRVYDERKEESSLTMKDTENKREKIDSLLKYIEDRLATLESEKEELKEYQKWDKMKRALEYTLYEQEQRDNRTKELRLQQQREEINLKRDELNARLAESSNTLRSVKRATRDLENRFAGLKEDREALNADQTQVFQQKTAVELRVQDLAAELSSEITVQTTLNEDLAKVKAAIATKTQQRDAITPRFRELQARENELDTRIKILNSKRNELYSKQGAGDRFKTKEERDKHIEKELRALERQIRQEVDSQERLEREIQAEAVEYDNLRELLAHFTQDYEKQREEMDSKQEERLRLSKSREERVMRRKELWREEQNVQAQAAQLDEDYRQAENNLAHSAGKGSAMGIASVKKVLAALAERGGEASQQVIAGYHGTFIDNFTTDVDYFRAVDTIAGARLFYHVVDDDRIATKIINEMNRMKLAGEVNFFPLNRLAHVQDPQYPVNQNALPMQTVIYCDDKFDIIRRSVFSRAMVCRDMQVGTMIAKENRLDCVTLEGDTVSSKGTMTGGYIDTNRRKSRLELRSTVRDLVARRAEMQQKEQELRTRLNQVDGEINKFEQELGRLDVETQQAKSEFAMMTDKRRVNNERLHLIQQNKRGRDANLLQVTGFIRQLQAKREDKKAELGAELGSQLTADEQEQLENIQNETKQLLEELDTVTIERRALDEKKSALDNELEAKLIRQRDTLLARLTDMGVDEKRHDLELSRNELAHMAEKIKEASTRLASIEEDMQEYTTESERLLKEFEAASEAEREILAGVQECSKNQELIATKNTAIQRKKEELKKRFMEIGALPADAFDKYQNLSHKQLEKKLLQCNQELKKYENVNKKALDQFVSFSEQKEKLVKRKDELDLAKNSIIELMNTLDQRKNEAIHLTFKQVSRNFEDVFQRLVPGGKGQLIMRRGAAAAAAVAAASEVDESRDDEDDDGEDEEGAERPTKSRKKSPARAPPHEVDTFCGVGIKVSFTGTAGETREMQQLSGGQKSLVALALIFAIQKCDPAPFYLFDEIDAALDAQHRKAVADMIHSLSDNAQFITTTFRPELLEHADKFYGVVFRSKVSHVLVVDRQQANEFVESDETHS